MTTNFFEIDPNDPNAKEKMLTAAKALLEKYLGPLSKLENPMTEIHQLGISEQELGEVTSLVALTLYQAITKERLQELAIIAAINPNGKLFQDRWLAMLGEISTPVMLLYIAARLIWGSSTEELDLPNLDFLKGD